MKALTSQSRLGGIYANKRGYHNKRKNLPMPGHDTDYSVNQFSVDRQGPDDEPAAIDWTFNDAHSGNYSTISKFSKRLYAARLDADNTRTKYIREFFGQIDSDPTVEGWDFSKDRASTSDKSHLWHIHLSIHRKYVNDPMAMRAILSILRGESLAEFKSDHSRTVTYQLFSASMPILKMGDSDPLGIYSGASFVDRAQRQLNVTPDGEYGPATAKAVSARGFGNGNTINLDVWEQLFGMFGADVEETESQKGTKRSIAVDRFHARLPILKYGDSDITVSYVARLQKALGVKADGEYGPATAAKVKAIQGGDGKTVDITLWSRLYALRNVKVLGTVTNK
jgi:peptidoglycan hydrolase-like protein with peptidoglycan-binding domain